jgi:hypothetical protein
VTSEQAAWVLFCGATFVLMGAGLFADAPIYAQAARDWQERHHLGEPSGAPRREAGRLVWAYRAGGVLFAAVGAWLVAALAFFPELLAARLRPPALGWAGRLFGGMFFAAAGAVLASARAGDWARGRPRSASFWSGAALAALFLVFSAFLFSRILQGDAP